MGENMIPRHPRMGTLTLSEHLKRFDASSSERIRRSDSVSTVQNDVSDYDVKLTPEDKVEKNTNNLCESRHGFVTRSDEKAGNMDSFDAPCNGQAFPKETSHDMSTSTNRDTNTRQTFLDGNVQEVPTFVSGITEDFCLPLTDKAGFFQTFLGGNKIGLYRLWEWMKRQNNKTFAMGSDKIGECDILNYNRNAAGSSPRSESGDVKCDRNTCAHAVDNESHAMKRSGEVGSDVPGQSKGSLISSDSSTLNHSDSAIVNYDNNITVNHNTGGVIYSGNVTGPPNNDLNKLPSTAGTKGPSNDDQNRLNCNDNAIGLLLEKDAVKQLRVFRSADKLAGTVPCGKFCAFSVLGMTFVMALYCFFGAVMFMGMEGLPGIEFSPEDSQERVIQDLRRISTNRNLELEAVEWKKEVDQILTEFRESIKAHATDPRWDDQGNSKWTWMGALLFTVTLITTVGNGYVPLTTLVGRMAAVVYALLGIPLAMAFFTSVSFQMARCMRHLYPKIASKISSRRFLTKPKVPAWICFSLVFIYLCVAAAVFSQMEDWGYPESFYFCFTLLFTIGLDSYMPGFNDSEGSTARHAVCIAYLLIGLILVATCFHLMARDCLNIARRVAIRWSSKKETEEEEDEFMTNTDLLTFDTSAQGDTNPNRYLPRGSPTPGTSTDVRDSSGLAVGWTDDSLPRQQPDRCHIPNQQADISSNRCTNQSSALQDNRWHRRTPCGANCCRLAKDHPSIPSPEHPVPADKVLQTLPPLERAALSAAEQAIDWILDAEVSDNEDDQVTSSSAEDPSSSTAINVDSLFSSSAQPPTDIINHDRFAESKDVYIDDTGLAHYLICESEKLSSPGTATADCDAVGNRTETFDDDEKIQVKDKDRKVLEKATQECTSTKNEPSNALKRLLQAHQETYFENVLARKRLHKLRRASESTQETPEGNDVSQPSTDRDVEECGERKLSVNPIIQTVPSTQLSGRRSGVKGVKEDVRERDTRREEDKKVHFDGTTENIHSLEGVPKPRLMTDSKEKSKKDRDTRKHCHRHSASRHDSLKVHRKHFKEHPEGKHLPKTTTNTESPNTQNQDKSQEISDKTDDRQNRTKPPIRKRRPGTQAVPEDPEKQAAQVKSKEMPAPAYAEIRPVTEKKSAPANPEPDLGRKASTKETATVAIGDRRTSADVPEKLRPQVAKKPKLIPTTSL